MSTGNGSVAAWVQASAASPAARTRAAASEGDASAFSALYQRAGLGEAPAAAQAEAAAAAQAEAAAPRPVGAAPAPTLGDALLERMGQLADKTNARWKEVAAPVDKMKGFNSADLLTRQMQLHQFMLEVEFASLLGKQAAKTIDQVSRTQ